MPTPTKLTSHQLADNSVTNDKAAQMPAHTFKGNNTGSTANTADLTATQLTAELNAMVGDTGSGGTKGLVPAPAAGDAAAGKFLKADGSYAVPAGGGGGSSSGSPEQMSRLSAAELGQSYPLPQNTILDSFDSDTRGTKSNCAASSDALRISVGQTAATYTRQKDTTPSLSKIEGYFVGTLQALAPKGTTIASDIIKFSGDCSEFFVSGKNVIICKKQTFDSEIVHTALLDTTNFVAQLAVSSSSYNSGTDETSLTLTNTNSLDLSMGLSSSSYNSTLRVLPFDIQVKVKALTAQAFDQIDITDVSSYLDVSNSMSVVRLPGENFLKKLAILIFLN